MQNDLGYLHNKDDYWDSYPIYGTVKIINESILPEVQGEVAFTYRTPDDDKVVKKEVPYTPNNYIEKTTSGNPIVKITNIKNVRIHIIEL